MRYDYVFGDCIHIYRLNNDSNDENTVRNMKTCTYN